MSQSELQKALENSRAALEHPLVMGIALISESPNQALIQAQNRGLSKEEQTWCRLLAKTFKIARELGMDALSILPHDIKRKDNGNMLMTPEIQTHLAVLKALVTNHQCAGGEYYEDSWIEIVKDILALNKMYEKEIHHLEHKERRDFFLNFVSNLIMEEGNGDAILLLIGNESLKARVLLLTCITEPWLRKFFYTDEFGGKHIADVSKVRRKTIGPFMALFAEQIDEIFCGEKKYSANLLFADYFFMYYGHCPTIREEDVIVLEAREIIQKICGRDIFEDKELAATLYRAMVFDTIPGANSLAEIATTDITEATRQQFCNEDAYHYYAKPPVGETVLVNFPNLEGDDTFFIISDPENTADRFSYLAQNAKVVCPVLPKPDPLPDSPRSRKSNSDPSLRQTLL